MSSVNNAFTLKQILLGISESLNEAQHQLRNTKPYDEFGRPNTLYTLPYLDFNLEVEATFEKNTQTPPQPMGMAKTTAGAGMSQVAAYSQPEAFVMAFKPAKKSTGTKENSKVYSTISGRFVAVVPNEGMPQLIINAVPKKISMYAYAIEAEAFNAAGEKVSGALVEFNYDRQKTDLLNPGTALNHATVFTQASEAKTDANGMAKTALKVDSTDYDGGHTLVIAVNLGNVSTSISIQKQ